MRPWSNLGQLVVIAPRLCPNTTTRLDSSSTTIQRQTSHSTILCGMTASRTFLFNTCRKCRDVPKGDINSALTNWVCSCGRCWKVHQAEGGDCEQRRLKRTVVRLAAFQCRLAELFNTLTYLRVVDGYQHPASFERRYGPGLPAHPTRVLYRRSARRPASQETPIAMTLPDEIRRQAASVENCVGAIMSLSPALAWLTRGMTTLIGLWEQVADDMHASSSRSES